MAATDSEELYPQCPFPCGDNPRIFCKHAEHVMEGTFVWSSLTEGFGPDDNLTDWFGPDDGWDIRVWEVRVCARAHVHVWITFIGRCACVCENLRMFACVST